MRGKEIGFGPRLLLSHHYLLSLIGWGPDVDSKVGKISTRVSGPSPLAKPALMRPPENLFGKEPPRKSLLRDWANDP